MWLDAVLRLLRTGRHSTRSYRMRTRSSGRRRRKALCLEQLEDRFAPATALLVTGIGDAVALDGVVTLREALMAANTNQTVNEAVHDGSSGMDSITFDTAGVFAMPQTILLAGTELSITDAVTITGPGAALLTLSGNDASRLFAVEGPAAIDAALSGLSLAAGRSARGGAIANFGNLTVTDVVLAGNSADFGGGIFNSGALTVVDSTLTGNTAGTFLPGGGLFNDIGGTATIRDCVFVGNSAGVGGGIYNEFGGKMAISGGNIVGNFATAGAGIYNGGALSVGGCTLSDHSVFDFGGGIYNHFSGTLTVSDSTLSNNSATRGGGIFNGGELTVSGCTLVGGSALSGGGLFNDGGEATITNSTLAENSALHFGGGICNDGIGAVTILDSCLAGNSTESNGGGIFNGAGRVTIINSTVSGNSAGHSIIFDSTGNGGGIFNDVDGRLLVGGSTLSGNSAGREGGGFFSAGTVRLNNTIVADNLSGGQIRGGGTFTGSNNLIEGEYPAGLIGTITADPMLGPLQDNGGPTLTHALLPGSPAIGAGSNQLVPAGIATDQRGSGYARVVGGTVDVGAFELQAVEPFTLTGKSVFENQPAGSFVGTFHAGGPDTEGAFAFALVSGAGDTGNASFTIDPSGNLLTAVQLDFESAASHSIRVRATAAGGSFTEETFTIDVVDVDGAPTIASPGALIAFEDVDQLVGGLGIYDPEGGNQTVTLTVEHGTLLIGTTTDLVVLGDGSGSVTLSGSLDAFDLALAGLSYRGALDYSGQDTLVITAGTGGLSTVATVAVTVKSAAQQAAESNSLVNALRMAGVLDRRQAKALFLDLKGSKGDAGKVEKFLDEVNALLAAAVLTPEQAETLLGPGRILLLSVTRR